MKPTPKPQTTPKPITGTHVYSMLKCARAVALDLHEDRSRRRALREEEEFVRQRGREHEARFVAELGYPEPEFERGDFEAGARATAAMLADGVPGVSQGVLRGEGKLGIPDLLRREPGRSRFGDWHYVVGDVKSSGQPRGDQILQVAFYSELLGELQGTAPGYGFLLMKDGREERFELAPYGAALDDVLARIAALRDDPVSERPFLARACETCHWSEVCLPELLAADDPSLLQGMTRGLRQTLESAGIRTCAGVRGMVVERTARHTHLDAALLRRLRRAAAARHEGRPQLEARPKRGTLDKAAFVHFLTDPFEERVLFLGVLYPDGRDPDQEPDFATPSARAEEWPAFQRLIARLPREVKLLHYGRTVPHWYEEHAHRHTASVALEARFVDLARHLRGAAVFQGPVFDLAGHVRHGLGLDPHRAGRAAAAAPLARADGGTAWLRQKGQSDLRDLVALKRALIDDDGRPAGIAPAPADATDDSMTDDSMADDSVAGDSMADEGGAR